MNNSQFAPHLPNLYRRPNWRYRSPVKLETTDNRMKELGEMDGAYGHLPAGFVTRMD